MQIVILNILLFTDKVVLVMTYVVIPVECLSGSQCHTLTLCSLVRFLRGPVYILEWFQSCHPNPVSFRESVCATNPKCLCCQILYIINSCTSIRDTLELSVYVYMYICKNNVAKKQGFDEIALRHNLPVCCSFKTIYKLI